MENIKNDTEKTYLLDILQRIGYRKNYKDRNASQDN